MSTITVIGEALVDIVPADGRSREIPGGGPANVAFGLARLGVPVNFWTWIGNDERGRRIAAHLQTSGVHLTEASRQAARTSTARVSVDSAGVPSYHFDVSWDLPDDRAPGTDWIHIGSIGAFLEPGAEKVRNIVAAARRTGSLVSFDPNIRPALMGDHDQAVMSFEHLAAACDVVKMSDEDAEWLYPGASADAMLDSLHGYGVRLAALTRGADGSVLSSGADHVPVASPQVSVTDTVGAGDTYMTALLWQLIERPQDGFALSQDDLAAMGDICARAAAITVSREGADLPTLEELRAATQR